VVLTTSATVVTVLLVNSDSATAAELDKEFQTAELVDYAYKPTSQAASGSWPTLQELINDGTRLLTFVASVDTSAQAPYLMDEWDYVFENPYDVTSPYNFSCTPDRPSSVKGDLSTALSSNRLPLMNHFLYAEGILDIQYPNVSYVSTTNAPSGGVGNLGDAAAKCKKMYNRAPAFILVDFATKGPAIATVDKLNNVQDPVGRSDAAKSQTSGASTVNNVFSGLVELASKARAGANPSMGQWVWVGGQWGGLLGGGITM
jgi:hypothetical protein